MRRRTSARIAVKQTRGLELVTRTPPRRHTDVGGGRCVPALANTRVHQPRLELGTRPGPVYRGRRRHGSCLVIGPSFACARTCSTASENCSAKRSQERRVSSLKASPSFSSRKTMSTSNISCKCHDNNVLAARTPYHNCHVCLSMLLPGNHNENFHYAHKTTHTSMYIIIIIIR